jgi:hypothetical protein
MALDNAEGAGGGCMAGSSPNVALHQLMGWMLLHHLSVQISLKTKDVFIECTATDLTKAKIVLNTVSRNHR